MGWLIAGILASMLHFYLLAIGCFMLAIARAL